MGSGFSTVCGSKRSVLISNSVRKLPTIPEHDVDSDIENDLEINPRSGKLHPAESRDSGIGENDIPNGYVFQRVNGSEFLKSSSVDSSPEKTKATDNDEDHDGNSSRPSRPHSCRLGHRGHQGTAKRTNQRTEVSESQIRRMVRSARGQPGVPVYEKDTCDDAFSDDTLSLNSSSSPTRENNSNNSRPKSARRQTRKNRNSKADVSGRTSAQTISDLDSSTDTEISDTDMLSIPDETGAFIRSKENTPRRRGWVKTEDFTDVILSTSVTPRVGASTDMYRIVSGTYSDIDVNLAKKASERSISSIILTPMDGTSTPTNLDCFDAPNDLYCHCEGSLEDLVTSLIVALERQKSRGPCTQTDYENVMKGLRYQLVGIAMGYMCRQSTPRIEVKGEQSEIFSDESWRVQIRLRTEDEEIIESSEKILAQRLSKKGKHLCREDISILLAEHLKTIEKLQQVQDACKLKESSDLPSPGHTLPQKTSSETINSISKRPGSASKLRKLNSGKGETSKPVSDTTNSELPPIGNTKGNKSRPNANKQKLKAKSLLKGDNTVETKESTKIQVESLQPSTDTKSMNRKSFNESGIDSEELEDIDSQETESEDSVLFGELAEAVTLLWETITPADVADLLKEYRKRETTLLSSATHTTKQTENTKTPLKDAGGDKISIEKCNDSNSLQMGQSLSAPDDSRSTQDVEKLDGEFVKLFKDKQKANDFTLDRFGESLTVHMKKTRLIRVQSFTLREDGVDWNGNQRSNSFTGFGNSRQNINTPTGSLKRQHSFSGAVARQNSFTGASRQNSLIRSLPASRQNSLYRSRSRGSTGSSNTFSTTSSGISSGLNSEVSGSEGSGSCSSKSALSREFSYGVLNEFEDIEELDEDAKTGRSNKTVTQQRVGSDTLRPPSGRRSNGSRATSGNIRERERRRGQTQVHGLGPTPTDPVNTTLRKIEEDSLPKVEEIDTKMSVRSRPDSGIAVSTSSASYSSSEPHKERDLDEPCLTTSCHEMLEKVSKVLADQHNDMKSLVAAVTKGLNSDHNKAQSLYCWLTSQDLTKFEKVSKSKNSPPGRLKQLLEKKTSYTAVYMDMLKVAGLKCVRVDGYVKSADYLPGNTVQTAKFQHAWVAVCMDGHYRLVDPQYGALRDKFVLDHYFATSPDELILSHFPKDKRWLLMNQPAAIEFFEGTVKIWPAMFHFSIRPLNMKSVIRTYDGRLSITVLLQNVAVNPQLEYAGPGPEIDSDTLEEQIDHEIRDVDNAETYHVTLPQEGNYYFTVYAHVLEDCIDIPVFQYRIEYIDELL